MARSILFSLTALLLTGAGFRDDVAPLLETHCVRCHSGAEPKGGLDLTTDAGLLRGGDSGAVVTPGRPAESYLLDLIGGDAPEMPKNADPLSSEQVALLRDWIAAGADWPADLVLEARREPWWSLEPLTKPPIPEVDADWIRTPIDAFILAKLNEHGLRPSPAADRRTLIRRLSFDLHGLPPTPAEIERFVNDARPNAYARLVDRLLASPRFGERWARHWLDVVHYADTHGYDKDKVRTHAWPYRDWVIRALNADKPYDEFAAEQLAGDVLAPGRGVVATGFIAAGPWDFVGHVELREGTVDKAITRNLDRDDMVTNTMSTFTSLTVHCARCHDHKFDPITQEDYYSLQAVFAGIGRADRPYEPNPQAAARRENFERRIADLAAQQRDLQRQITEAAGPELARIEKQIAAAQAKQGPKRPEFGYHSQIARQPDTVKWVQVDLGKPVPIEQIVYVGCHDDFAGIGAGFGFPVRYRIELSNDADFESGVTLVADYSHRDLANLGVTPQSVDVDGMARYVRITATRLAERKNDYIFALAELAVFTPDGHNAASSAKVTALDSIEAPVRWRKQNLVDGIYYGGNDVAELRTMAALQQRRRRLLAGSVDARLQRRQKELAQALAEAQTQLNELPPRPMVYAAAPSFAKQGNFTSTESRPRPIHLLERGSVKSPGRLMGPGTVGCIDGLPARFDIEAEDEALRRAALAKWIVDKNNPLTWRSIVNRVWHYHFGKGIVATPNDFGRMGALPTHPDLLDWLAAEFRGPRSLKALHRLIVTSAVYRQQSANVPANARRDGGNQYLWRMNRRRLEAEEIRDAVLAISGRLDSRMHGPGDYLFGFEDDHSPRYKYEELDPDDPRASRRTVYRFIVRSVPDPFLETLDCADPSANVPVRNETVTALQALALLNNRFMVRQAEHFADRVAGSADSLPEQIERAFRLALGRGPAAAEIETMVPYARKHGLAHLCRLLLNANEFVFVD